MKHQLYSFISILICIKSVSSHISYLFPPDYVQVQSKENMSETLRSQIETLNLTPIEANLDCEYNDAMNFLVLARDFPRRKQSLALKATYRQMILHLISQHSKTTITNRLHSCNEVAESKRGFLQKLEPYQWKTWLSNHSAEKDCFYAYFYSSRCAFSLSHFPKLNMVPRYYRHWEYVAVDVYNQSMLALMYSLSSVPYSAYFRGGRLISSSPFPYYSQPTSNVTLLIESDVQYEMIGVNEFDISSGPLGFRDFESVYELVEFDYYAVFGVCWISFIFSYKAYYRVKEQFQLVS